MTKEPRSADFRYVYSNGVKIQFSANEVVFIFGMKESPGEEETLLEQVGVVTSPASAKLLVATLSRIIEDFERTSGIQIPLDLTNIEAVEKMIAAAHFHINPSPTVSSPPSEQSPGAAPT